jgi:hypothetical protein
MTPCRDEDARGFLGHVFLGGGREGKCQDYNYID